jgi:hypothetical protein
MQHLSALLTGRRPRQALQIGFGLVAAGAVVAAFSASTAARVAAVGLIALVSVATFKSVLVAASLSASLERRVLDVETILTDWQSAEEGQFDATADLQHSLSAVESRTMSRQDDLRSMIERLDVVTGQHDQRFLPDQEAARTILRRVDPLAVQLAVTRNELLTLAEAVERLDRRVGRVDG